MNNTNLDQALLGGILPSSFIRGAIATGIISAVQDQRRGLELLQSALLGGAALSTATGLEQWVVKKGKNMGKKGKGKNKGLGLGLGLGNLGNLGLGDVDLGLGLGLGQGKKKKKLKGQQLQQLEQLQALLGQRRGGLAALPAGQQFLWGALLGVSAAYVLGNEELRGKLLRAGVGLYETLAGGLAEMKEQVADIQAERAAL